MYSFKDFTVVNYAGDGSPEQINLDAQKRHRALEGVEPTRRVRGAPASEPRKTTEKVRSRFLQRHLSRFVQLKTLAPHRRVEETEVNESPAHAAVHADYEHLKHVPDAELHAMHERIPMDDRYHRVRPGTAEVKFFRHKMMQNIIGHQHGAAADEYFRDTTGRVPQTHESVEVDETVSYGENGSAIVKPGRSGFSSSAIFRPRWESVSETKESQRTSQENEKVRKQRNYDFWQKRMQRVRDWKAKNLKKESIDEAKNGFAYQDAADAACRASDKAYNSKKDSELHRKAAELHLKAAKMGGHGVFRSDVKGHLEQAAAHRRIARSWTEETVVEDQTTARDHYDQLRNRSQKDLEKMHRDAFPNGNARGGDRHNIIRDLHRALIGRTTSDLFYSGGPKECVGEQFELIEADIGTHYASLRSKPTAELLKLHGQTLGRVHSKYTAAEVGGKHALIADIMRYHHGNRFDEYLGGHQKESVCEDMIDESNAVEFNHRILHALPTKQLHAMHQRTLKPEYHPVTPENAHQKRPEMMHDILKNFHGNSAPSVEYLRMNEDVGPETIVQETDADHEVVNKNPKPFHPTPTTVSALRHFSGPGPYAGMNSRTRSRAFGHRFASNIGGNAANYSEQIRFDKKGKTDDLKVSTLGGGVFF